MELKVIHHQIVENSYLQKPMHVDSVLGRSKLPTVPTTRQTSNIVESAGNASSNHISSSPLQTDANFNWNADSGATSHMTPHAHWIHNYTSFQTPIHLANNIIIYSAGIGSVRFAPMIRGQMMQVVEFT